MPITAINHRHREIARRMLLGEKQREIAQALRYSEEHISRIKRSPAFQRLLLEMQTQADKQTFDVVAHMALYAMPAAKQITDTLTDPESPPAVRLAAAKEVLKRIGAFDLPREIPGPEEGMGFEDMVMMAETDPETLE